MHEVCRWIAGCHWQVIALWSLPNIQVARLEIGVHGEHAHQDPFGDDLDPRAVAHRRLVADPVAHRLADLLPQKLRHPVRLRLYETPPAYLPDLPTYTAHVSTYGRPHINNACNLSIHNSRRRAMMYGMAAYFACSRLNTCVAGMRQYVQRVQLMCWMYAQPRHGIHTQCIHIRSHHITRPCVVSQHLALH